MRTGLPDTRNHSVTRLLAILGVLALAALGARPAPAHADGQVIVLGDSIAAGCCVAPELQWAPLFAGRLGAELHNVAVGGTWSDSLLGEVHTWPSGRTQPQIDEAVSLLHEAAPGSVRAVTFGIGVNDMFWVMNGTTFCVLDPAPPCPQLAAERAAHVKANIDTALTKLRAAMEPGTPLLVMNYYDPASGPYETYMRQMVQALDPVIASEAAEHGATLVDANAYFAGHQGEWFAIGDIHPGPAGHLALANIFSNAVPPDSDGDGLSNVMERVLATNPSVRDSDGDGCPDGREFGPNVGLGGGRDPTSVWDYFDTPGTANHRDGRISTADILRVVKRYDSSGNPDIDPLSTPPPPPAYHTAFDRTGPGTSPNGRPQGPNGSIRTEDVAAVISQYGNRCA